MHRSLRWMLLLCILLLGCTAPDYPAVYTEKVDTTPDLDQTDPALGLIRDGMTSCCSVAVTNAWGWLAQYGEGDYDNLVVWDAAGQVDYALTAQAMDDAFHLAQNSGVLPRAFIRYLSQYLEARGYASHSYSMTFYGWYEMDDFKTEDIPQLDTIKAGMVGDAAVWLFVGMYDYDSESDTYTLLSHHYVTLVGYGVDAQGNANPDMLIVHDPAPRSGDGVSHDYVSLQRLEHGTLTLASDSLWAWEYSQLPLDATGYYQLVGDFAVPYQADVAILDGVILLRME